MVHMNVKLSINFSLHVIVLSLSSFFSIGAKKVIYIVLYFLLSNHIDRQILLLNVRL